jgi:ATPase subunit of ABC transporter with duplicated ATPase domains
MIHLHQISHCYGQKTCLNPFSATIYHGQKIALIGQNGCGKSTLLNIIRGEIQPTEGVVARNQDIIIGSVAQIITDFGDLSGGERFNKALSQALATQPTLLCLDEPTNHLDQRNRQSLLRMLSRFSGTLIVVTHDLTLLRACIDEIWHIEEGEISIFSGSYEDYKVHWEKERHKLQTRLSKLALEKKQSHLDLMQEQRRSKNKRQYGEKKYGKDGCNLKSVANQKAASSQATSGKNHKSLTQQKKQIVEELRQLKVPEIIHPTFSLPGYAHWVNKTILTINKGACGYGQTRILDNIDLQLRGGMHLAIKGNNSAGKSTLVKAILNEPGVNKSGIWQVPLRKEIAYLDQHYGTLKHDISVADLIQEAQPNWTTLEVRRHLNDFLFKKENEVNALVSTLSGGEKCRLCLAQFAALTPKLLILDEVTNNLDLRRNMFPKF